MKAAHIQRIFAKSRPRKSPKRKASLTPRQRARIRKKTGGKCHVCGGALGSDWQADHVVPHHLGGARVEDNYLPACRRCNRLRWAYRPEVLQLILRFGVIAKQQIRHDTELGRQLLRLAKRGFTTAWRRRRGRAAKRAT